MSNTETSPAARTAATDQGETTTNPQQIGTRRVLSFTILRYNPQDPASKPQQVQYELLEAPAMTLFIALNQIREQQEPSLQFDFVCRAGICGSCGMLINGKPGLACRTLTKDLPAEIFLAPLPGFELIGDLSVNTGKWMRAMSERVETWIHNNSTAVDFNALEATMDPSTAEQIYELERCIECGCCIAACATAQMNEDFVGAVAIQHVARFRIDPRDERSDAELYQLLGNEDGVFGCMTLLGCDDVCPKSLPLAQQLSYMRRKMVEAALFNKSN